MRQMVSIPDSETDIIEHLKRQDDISKYIRKLIRNDMCNSLEDIIRHIVREELAGKTIAGDIPSPADSEIDNSILGILKGL